ncbi:spermidine synthase [Cupriavidus sp. 2MCAB6]|uniref:spermine/spermidine synthase domain-containing protein n=1 Tax=Cupriavidus sp. 2MCAB6 TaxID=3232981 RepID=UPI003F8FE46A
MRREPGGGKSAILPEGKAESGHPAAPAGGHLQWTEWLSPGIGTTLGQIRLLAAVRSPYQQIEIGENARFGRIFRLDGRVMCAEADAFIQHELMVHPMAVAHGAARSALVVGGGDGGSARELLRLPFMREVVVAELDPEVVTLARAWLDGIHQGAFDDPRVHLAIGDALGLMEAFGRAGRRFDLIVFDLTEADDGSPAAALFSAHGLQAARRCLAPGGALSLQLGPPEHRPDPVRVLCARLRQCFAQVQPLSAFIPVHGASWAIALASDALDVRGTGTALLGERLRAWKLERTLRCYHAALHPALFTLPRHLQALFDSAGAPA